MKKSLLVLAICIGILFFGIVNVSAETVAEGECGEGLTWTLDSEGKLTVSGRGEMSYFVRNSWSALKSSVVSVVIEDGVASIDDDAFSGCYALESIAIPQSVTSIGNDAFSGCYALESIAIPQSVTSIGNDAFIGCSALESIAIPQSVTSIGRQAFFGCTRLTNITIPSGVTSIGYGAFGACDGLLSIVVDENNTAYTSEDGVLFDKEKELLIQFAAGSKVEIYEIPNDVKSICDYAFDGCVNLVSVDIPDNVVSIGYSAFYGCSNLTSADLPGGLKSLGKCAFYDCNSLLSVTVPDGIASICGATFYYCKSLTGVVVPSSVESIEQDAFYGCSGLTSVTISNGVKSIGESAFRYCTKLESVTIPDSVNTVGGMAFDGCHKLSSLTLGSNLTSMGANAFSNSALTSVTIPASVTSIGTAAFVGCKSLKSIKVDENNAVYTSVGGNLFDKEKTQLLQYAIGKEDTMYEIPKNVTSIGRLAFSGCKLAYITIPYSVTGIDSMAFYNCAAVKKVYYYGTVAEWESTGGSKNTDLKYKISYQKHTRTTASMGGRVFAVKPVNIGAGKVVIVALYKEKQLAEVQRKVYESELLEFTTTQDYDTVKVMVWESVTALTPITEPEVIE